MKKLLALMILLSFCQVLRAQGELLDKEKLLDFYQTQRYAEAAQYLESVYPSDTENITALSQIAYCYLMSGKLAEAEIKYLKINELKPNTLPVLFSLTNINARRGNKPTAQLYVSNILKIDSTNFNAYKQAAGLTDSSALKLIYLQKANQLNPKEAVVAYDLADQLKFLQKFQQAYNVLQVAIDADSGNFVLQQVQLPIANDLKKYQDVIRVGEMLLEKGFDGKIVKDVGRHIST